MLSHRAAFALVIFATPAMALAQDAEPKPLGPSEVCTVTLTETITAPKKPNIFESELDCGAKSTELQAHATKLVHNTMNLADALEVMTDLGYTVSAGNTRVSYNGHQIISVFVLAAANPTGTAAPTAQAPAAPTSSLDALPEADLPEDAEATEPAPLNDEPFAESEPTDAAEVPSP